MNTLLSASRSRDSALRLSELTRSPNAGARPGRWLRRSAALATTLLVPLGVAVLFIAATPELSSAATTGDNGTHDPSRIIESDGRFYFYSTGGGSKSSADGLAWTNGPGLFAGGGIPQSTTSVVSNNEGVWAPDVIYLNGEYYVYYSIANAQNACAVGLVTSPTLNPSAANYKWTDRGLVVSNTGSATYCTIDPAPLLDATGNLWLAWGSGYSHSSTADTIFVTRLDNTTGLASSADSAKPGHPLEQGHIEASYIYYHSGYYYLFWNSGGCCSGASSTYLIHVARSQTVTGPYSGTKNFYGSTGSIHGPGHIGIYDECGASRFTYHYYPDSGGSVLGENELTWGGDGWPVVGAESTTPLKPCGQMGVGGAGGGVGAGGAGGGVAQGGSAGLETDNGGAPSGGTPTTGLGGEPGGIAGTPGDVVAGSGPLAAGAGNTSSAGNTGVVAPAAGSSGTPDASSSSGCSCRVNGGRGSTGSAAAILLFGAAVSGLRRRRRSSRARS